jgi:glucose/arabinose dehydrogenase
VILRVDQPYANHNGGHLAFGPDGYLYIGLGDGGSGGDPRGNGQNPAALLGKMLRIDVNAALPYGIPGDNPFREREGYRPEIWALGLRNPWRYSFDRATGDLYIADVGQNAYEEVNFQPANSRGGENYGWNHMEGAHCFRASPQCDPAAFTLPVAEYGRGGGCSITGGYVYRGTSQPALRGVYFFADYCTGKFWALQREAGGAWVTTELIDTDVSVASFGEDEAGEVYVVGLGDGRVYRLVADNK